MQQEEIFVLDYKTYSSNSTLSINDIQNINDVLA